MALASVVIPAYNEAAVIDRCLDAIADPELQIVVAVNGTTDDTAARARTHGVEVVEVVTASKTAALNAADHVCGDTFPRIYLDADIVLSAADAKQLAQVLRDIPDPAAAAPKIEFDVRGASRLVRRFYRAYARLPYISEGLVGAGCYAVNEAGRHRWAEFPDITADDLFVQGRFDEAERHVVSSARFRVSTCRTMRSLLKQRTRTYAGNAEAARLGLNGSRSKSRNRSLRSLVQLAFRSPGQATDLAVYLVVNLAAAARARLRKGSAPWLVDTSSRSPSPS